MEANVVSFPCPPGREEVTQAAREASLGLMTICQTENGDGVDVVCERLTVAEALYILELAKMHVLENS